MWTGKGKCSWRERERERDKWQHLCMCMSMRIAFYLRVLHFLIYQKKMVQAPKRERNKKWEGVTGERMYEKDGEGGEGARQTERKTETHRQTDTHADRRNEEEQRNRQREKRNTRTYMRENRRVYERERKKRGIFDVRVRTQSIIINNIIGNINCFGLLESRYVNSDNFIHTSFNGNTIIRSMSIMD